MRDMENGKCCSHIVIKQFCFCHNCNGEQCNYAKEKNNKKNMEATK
jgi:hypothetical protein